MAPSAMAFSPQEDSKNAVVIPYSQTIPYSKQYPIIFILKFPQSPNHA